MTCSICWEDVSLIDCPGCNDSNVCKDCARTYILNEGDKCSICSITWTPRFLSTVFDLKWLFDKSKTGYLGRVKSRRLEKERKRLNITIREIKGPDNSTIYKLVTKCPSQTCRGMVSGANYKCVVCNAKVCSKCWLIKSNKHKCNPDDVKSVKLIRNDSVPCPKCAISVHKISGCDQMWCPDCKITFNWVTGKEERGTIHNPHAIQWFKSNKKVQDVRVLGNLCLLPSVIVILKTNLAPRDDEIMSIYQTIEFLYQKIIDQQHQLRNKVDKTKIRRQWVKCQLNDDQFADQILLLWLKRRRTQNILYIDTLLYHITVDKFIILINKSKDIGSLRPNDTKYLVDLFVKSFTKITDFINKQYKSELQYLDKTSYPQIVKNGRLWHWIDVKY